MKKAHDFLRKYVNCDADFKTSDARGIADDLWDAIHKGDMEWRKVHSRNARNPKSLGLGGIAQSLIMKKV